MNVSKLTLEGLLLITPEVHADERGFFMETAHEEKFQKIGIIDVFVQDNHSHSKQNVVRGLKYQYNKPTSKLVRVVQGTIVAAALDLRKNSSTFGKLEKVLLSAENKQMLYLPFGFAFGFAVHSETADVLYKLSALHNPTGSGTINCLDPELAIDWGVESPVMTQQDRLAPTFSEWKEANFHSDIPSK